MDGPGESHHPHEVQDVASTPGLASPSSASSLIGASRLHGAAGDRLALGRIQRLLQLGRRAAGLAALLQLTGLGARCRDEPILSIEVAYMSTYSCPTGASART